MTTEWLEIHDFGYTSQQTGIVISVGHHSQKVLRYIYIYYRNWLRLIHGYRFELYQYFKKDH